MKWPHKIALAILPTMIFLISAYAFTSLTSNKKSLWQAVKPSPETEKIITGHLTLGAFLSWEQAIDSATYRQISDRYRVYRFNSPQTCGSWGCLHVISDNYLQQTKAYHLKIPAPAQEASSLGIDEKDCILLTQANSDGTVGKYSLCLNPA
jgi:hypothetical protein